MIDLHTHTNASDGTDTPAELVKLAIGAGLRAIAITDHDTVDGIDEALKAAKNMHFFIIPGIEFSCSFDGDLHILGLYIEHKNKKLQSHLKKFLKSRSERNLKIIKQLQDAGLDVSVSDLDRFGDSIITKAHLAQILISKGYCSSVAEGINKYLAFGCVGHVHREKVTPKGAIELIKSVGGISCLAHVNQIAGSREDVRRLVGELKGFGLNALETRYPTYTSEDEEFAKSLCEEFSLLQSGGSDYHGGNKTVKLNAAKVSDEFLDEMERWLKLT